MIKEYLYHGKWYVFNTYIKDNRWYSEVEDTKISVSYPFPEHMDYRWRQSMHNDYGGLTAEEKMKAYYQSIGKKERK